MIFYRNSCDSDSMPYCIVAFYSHSTWKTYSRPLDLHFDTPLLHGFPVSKPLGSRIGSTKYVRLLIPPTFVAGLCFNYFNGMRHALNRTQLSENGTSLRYRASCLHKSGLDAPLRSPPRYAVGNTNKIKFSHRNCAQWRPNSSVRNVD